MFDLRRSRALDLIIVRLESEHNLLIRTWLRLRKRWLERTVGEAR